MGTTPRGSARGPRRPIRPADGARGWPAPGPSAARSTPRTASAAANPGRTRRKAQRRRQPLRLVQARQRLLARPIQGRQLRLGQRQPRLPQGRALRPRRVDPRRPLAQRRRRPQQVQGQGRAALVPVATGPEQGRQRLPAFPQPLATLERPAEAAADQGRIRRQPRPQLLGRQSPILVPAGIGPLRRQHPQRPVVLPAPPQAHRQPRRLLDLEFVERVGRAIQLAPAPRLAATTPASSSVRTPPAPTSPWRKALRRAVSRGG